MLSRAISGEKLMQVGAVAGGAVAAAMIQSTGALASVNADVKDGILIVGGLFIGAMDGPIIRAAGMGVAAAGALGLFRRYVMTG